MRKIVLCALMIFVCMAFAELPSASYYRLQEGAPEYFDIKILKVDVKKSNGWDSLTWQAEILQIFRSKSGAKVGQKITLKHQQPSPDQMATGPARAPNLRVGSIVPAFLRKTPAGHFDLAKYGRSFEIMARPDKPGSGS